MAESNVRHTDVRALIDAQPAGRWRLLMYGVLFMTLAIDGMDTQITSYLAPAMARDWGIPMGRLGAVLAAGQAGSALGAVLLGALGDVVGYRRVAIFATLVVGCATLTLSYATSTSELVALRFLTGLGVGGSLPNLIALVSQLAPTRLRATVITWTGCGFPAGAALAGVIAGWILELHGWRVAYRVAGIFPFVLLPALVALVPESISRVLTRPDGQQTTRRLLMRLYPSLDLQGPFTWPSAVRAARAPLAAIFRDGLAARSVIVALLFFFSLTNVYFLANWLPGLLQRAHSAQHESIVATTLFNVGGIAGALVLGRLIDAYGFRRMLTLSLACVIAFMGFLAAGKHTTQALLIAAVIGGIFVNGSQGALNSVPALLFPDRMRATATGWAVGVGRLGFVGPLIAGYLLGAEWSYSQVLLMATIAPFMAIAMLQVLVRRGSGVVGDRPA
jgi:MFS transporter, AAHS family, 4-hydroxybenzoate transporter